MKTASAKGLPWRVLLVSSILLLVISPGLASAQEETFEVGDVVQFDHVGRTMVGEIVQSIGNGFIFKIEVVVDGEKKIFSRARRWLEHASEKAIARNAPPPAPEMRVWTDASGNYTIDAKMLDFDGLVVTLEKGDGQTVDVPLAKLSRADADFIREYYSDTPSVGIPLQLPPPTTMAQGRAVEVRSMDDSRPVEVDAACCSIELASIVTLRLPHTSLSIEMSQPLLATDSSATVVYSAASEKDGQPRTDILAANLVEESFRPVARFRGARLRLLDSDPVHSRALALTDSSERGRGLAVISGFMSGAPATDIHWQLPRDTSGTAPEIRRAFLTGQSIAVAQCEGLVIAWDVGDGRELWRCENGRSGLMAISPGGRFLALQREDLIGVVDVPTGDQLGSIKLSNASAAGLAFSPDAQRLLIGHLESVRVFDLRKWTVDSEMQLWNSPGHAYGASAWVDDQHVLLVDGLLVRPDKHAILWDYNVANRTRERFPTLPYGFFATFYRSGNVCALVATSLPHSDVPRLAPGDSRPDLALREGDSVAVNIDIGGAPIDGSEMRAAIESVVRRTGWEPAASGAAQLVVTMTQADERDVTYRTMIGDGPDEQTVKFAPWRTSLVLNWNGKTLWEHSYTPRSPQDVMSRTMSTQEIVRLAEVPDLDFLDRIALLPYITDPAYQNGYGQSVFDADGISPQR